MTQPFDYYCILDLEGKVEILEFPVTMIDAHSQTVVDSLHHYVRPTIMTEDEINRYIQGKYGGWGLAEKWHETAIPFPQVLQNLEQFLTKHNLLWKNNPNGHPFAFIICGDWDIKTQIPRQCVACDIEFPDYFKSWINVKDVYNFHFNPKNKVTGMKGLLGRLQIKLEGNHHSGVDDVHNIVKIVCKMMNGGVRFGITRSHDDISCKPNKEYVLEGIRNPPPPRKKTRPMREPCVFFQRGSCKYGDQCRFVHVK
jgi:ERI1 exoribonuclease 3